MTITFDHNKDPDLPRLVSCPRYTRLASLSLSGNSIYSIEPLQHNNTSNLKMLLLDLNLLTTVSPLKKMNFKSLYIISLSTTLIILDRNSIK